MHDGISALAARRLFGLRSIARHLSGATLYLNKGSTQEHLSDGLLTQIRRPGEKMPGQVGVGSKNNVALRPSSQACSVTLAHTVGRMVGFASISDWVEGGYGALAEGRGYRQLAVRIELAVFLDLLAIGMGMTVATARGLFKLARDNMLPKRLAGTNRRSIPDVATFVVSTSTTAAILVSLAIYGTAAHLTPDNSVVFRECASQSFLVAATFGSFLVCICYGLVAVGALAKFSIGRPIDLIAALLGLTICVLGVAAQFTEGTAPTGDAR